MKNKAFTLAEVLITLAIIGIVASLTIPAVIQSYKRHVYSAKLKKFVGLMETNVSKAEMDGNSWTKISYSTANGMEQLVRLTQKYIKITRRNNSGKIFVPNGERYSDILVLPDGSYFVYDTQWGANLIIGYDLNGDKKPNMPGRDRFFFYYCKSGQRDSNECKKTNRFEPYRFLGQTSRTKAYDTCKNRQSSFVYYCSSLLWYDGFEFKSDYPYKL